MMGGSSMLFIIRFGLEHDEEIDMLYVTISPSHMKLIPHKP